MKTIVLIAALTALAGCSGMAPSSHGSSSGYGTAGSAARSPAVSDTERAVLSGATRSPSPTGQPTSSGVQMPR